MILKRGHESVLEHVSLSVRIVTDRGVTHEIVRHRLASYSQESTRYCNYSGDRFGKEITVVLPVWFDQEPLVKHPDGSVDRDVKKSWIPGDVYSHGFMAWIDGMYEAEEAYFKMLDLGQSPQQARSVLPNSLKTEIVMTANLREWRHFFSLRATPAAHPQMRELAREMLLDFQARIPVVFDEFWVK